MTKRCCEQKTKKFKIKLCVMLDKKYYIIIQYTWNTHAAHPPATHPSDSSLLHLFQFSVNFPYKTCILRAANIHIA